MDDPLNSPSVELLRRHHKSASKNEKSDSDILDLVEKERDYLFKKYTELSSAVDKWKEENPEADNYVKMKRMIKNTGLGAIIITLIGGGSFAASKVDVSQWLPDRKLFIEMNRNIEKLIEVTRNNSNRIATNEKEISDNSEFRESHKNDKMHDGANDAILRIRDSLNKKDLIEKEIVSVLQDIKIELTRNFSRYDTQINSISKRLDKIDN